MTKNLFDVKKTNRCKYIKCVDERQGKELVAYGFIRDVEIEVVSKTKYGIVVRVLDGVFSLNYKLAQNIIVEVDSYAR